MSRIGLLGGTFDPPHYGHLLAAQEAAAQLELEQVLFLPARQNPLKQDAPSSEVHHRCAMVSCAIEDNPLFALSTLDVDRPPPSYTADLLRTLKTDPAAIDRELFFLVGADILPELPRWRSPDEILRLAHLVVVNRPGWPAPDLAVLQPALAVLQPAVPDAAERVLVLSVPGTDISARDLRTRVRERRPIRYLTPPAVERYIHAHGLYC